MRLRTRRALLLLLATASSALLAACSSEPKAGPAPTEPLVTPVPVSSMVMTVERQLVTGQKFVVTFSGRLSENRGGYLFVEDQRGARVALLRSDGNSQVPMGYELDPDRFDMLADGLSGTTSTFLFPAELLAGSYVLCTANSGPPDECTSVDVTSK